jgi:nucleoside-diphosphate kinase
MIESTLVLLKPDAVNGGLVGQLIARLERVGLVILAMQMRHCYEDLASQHYGDLDVRYSPEVKRQVVDFLCSGPMVAMVINGDGAVAVVRKLIGGTYPSDAAPGTIRGDYGHVSKDYAQANGRSVKNLIHASASVKEAQYEIALWFPDGLVTYFDYPDFTRRVLS